jgi:hypothetical protein
MRVSWDVRTTTVTSQQCLGCTRTHEIEYLRAKVFLMRTSVRPETARPATGGGGRRSAGDAAE